MQVPSFYMSKWDGEMPRTEDVPFVWPAAALVYIQRWQGEATATTVLLQVLRTVRACVKLYSEEGTGYVPINSSIIVGGGETYKAIVLPAAMLAVRVQQ